MDPYYREGRYSFRPVQESDLTQLAEHRNESSTWGNLTSPLPVSLHGQKDWIRSLGTRDFYFIGQVEHSNKLVDVGLLRLTDVDWVNRNAAVGVDIYSQYRGMGFSHPLFVLLCRYAFLELGMNHLWLLVLEDNERARRVYEKTGFKEEGRMRKHIYRHGAFKDYVLMGMLREEFDDDSAVQGLHE
jgi:RimJ/RimL family protein N-acetyltransferase